MKFEPKTSTAKKAVEKIAIPTGHVLLVLNGTPPYAEEVVEEAEHARVVLAADGGLAACAKAHVAPDLVIGDLDSVLFPELADAKTFHVRDQDSTDLEKTLGFISEHAVAPVHLRVLGWEGGRTDHFLNNLGVLLSAPTDWRVELLRGRETLYRLLPEVPLKLDDCFRSTISVLPFGGPCRGVQSSGLRWPLENADLVVGEFVSQSNEAVADQALLSCREGRSWVVCRRDAMNRHVHFVAG